MILKPNEKQDWINKGDGYLMNLYKFSWNKKEFDLNSQKVYFTTYSIGICYK